MSAGPVPRRKVQRLSRRAFEKEYRGLPTTERLIPVIDPTTMSYGEFCRAVTSSLEETGLVILRSAHADPALREEMQLGTAQFFALPKRIKAKTETARFQGGWTPPYSETPVDQAGYVISLDADQRPFWEDLTDDDKERVMFGIGWRPASSRFPDLMPCTRIMVGHEKWCDTMNRWGESMLSDTDFLLGALAQHYDLSPEVFSTKGGAHYVAPTGTPLNKFKVGKVVVRLHADMGLLTGHEKSIAYFSKSGRKAPCGGLIVWTKAGKKIRVVVPDGCRLFQAGHQLEFLTDGRIKAGLHQVVIPPEAAALIAEANRCGEDVWRITATLFPHLLGDMQISVLPPFREEGKEYPTIFAGKLDMDTLIAIFGAKKSRGRRPIRTW